MPTDFSKVNFPSSLYRETHGFLERDGKRLFRAEYRPSGDIPACMILCSPFAEEKVRTQRIYVSWARTLALHGAAAFCFDYFGDGDSEGDFEDASFEDRLKDIKAVYSRAQEKTGARIMALGGFRWGATLAALAAEELRPDVLVMWEPVVDTNKYFHDHLRSHLASQMLTEGKVVRNREQLLKDLEGGETLTVEGYELTGPFFFAASQSTLAERQFAREGKTLIVQIAANPSRLRPELVALRDCMKGSTLVGVAREFQWEKTEIWRPAPPQLFQTTLDYLNENGFFGRVL